MAKGRQAETVRARVRTVAERGGAADKGAAADKSGQVQSLQRALAILQTLANSHDGLTLTELSQTVGLAPSTTHRLLTTLQQQQFARFDPIGNVWQVGVGAFTVGNAFVRTRDVALMARPVMRQLMEDSGETVNLYVEDGGEAMCLTQIECRQLMRAIARPGGRVKMHCSSVGKAILAWLPDRDVTKVLERHGLPAFTEHTIATPRGLRDDLARIRARGYAVDDEEHAVGMRCVAAPIFDEHGRPGAAISVSGPAARIDDGRLALVGSLVVEAARTVTHELGGLSATRAAS
ncbi:IclR family transcriptional regulator domain-containing protein [Azospirillum halopraeferens]|uniref:IclR family transcriptional regulator domain-containing protein n=1 Tax=Azospirillum halopraeferens TaxID=34010 RepID=UPI0003FB1970|nr:IclR family transcriptional regulator C-terminal domain-containing protein [Azospirillum halopraeferens]